jgi:hypothetical protein
MSSTISHVILRKRAVQSDWKLTLPESENNGRKHVVKELWPKRERPIVDPEWVPEPSSGFTPVLVTGDGGTEIATFTEGAGQDRHKHLVSMETYTVLAGTLKIFIDDQGGRCAPAGMLRPDGAQPHSEPDRRRLES